MPAAVALALLALRALLCPAGLGAQQAPVGGPPAVEGPSPRLRLSFLGDLMIHRANYLSPDYRLVYRELEWLLRRDDLSFANLEFPVDPSRPYASYPCFNADLEYLRAAVDAGIDVLSLANNHVFDQGLEGLQATLGSLESAGRGSFRRLYHSGVRLDAEAPFAPTEIRVQGVRIGFLAVCQLVNQPMPAAHVQIADYENRRHRREFLPWVREQAAGYDLFVLSYHGGAEYAREPEAERASFFDRLLEAGVDILWAHHPHVLQPYRLVARSQGTGLILYSTGNLLSGMPLRLEPDRPEADLAWAGDSALWAVTVAPGPAGLEVQSVRPIPLVNYRTPGGEIRVLPFVALGGEPCSERWREYYRQRSTLLRSALRAWEAQARTVGP